MTNIYPIHRAIFVSCILFNIHPIAQAVDSISAEFGTGNRTKIARVGLQWNWNAQWWKFNDTHIGGYWDVNLAGWKGNMFQNIPDNSQNIIAAGFTPVFRFQRDSLNGPYAELGIGAYYLSELYDSNDRKLSTRFQFGDHLGIGYVFLNGIDIGMKLQHFSNGSIKKPNDGVDVIFLSVRRGF